MEPLEHAAETIEIGKELTEKLTVWGEAAVGQIPNVIVAVAILLLTWAAVKASSAFNRKVLPRFFQHPELASLAGGLMKLGIWAAGLFVALSVMELDKTVTSMLAGLGIVGLALGFAFQDLATNLMSGVMMAFRRPFKENDIVKTKDFIGIVQSTTLRAVHLKQFTGEIVIIPNKDIFQNALINYNARPCRRVDIEVGVAYGDDLEKAKQVILDAINALAHDFSESKPEVYFTGFGGSSVDMVARFWVDYDFQPDFLEARSKGIMAIKKAVDDAGLTIPFPIRTLDFGVVGGEKLNQNLHRLDALRGPSASNDSAEEKKSA